MEFLENWLFINPETYVEDEVNSALEQILLEYSRSLELDNTLSILSYSEREKTKKLFEKVVDQSVYFTPDHLKLRRMLVDIYSAHKAQITKARKSTDLNLLTNEELNEFIVSYGFPYPRNIISRANRIQFLSNLFQNYHKKGTSEGIANIISLYGLRNILISEWWIRYDNRREHKFFARSNIVHPVELRNDPTYETERSYNEFIKNNPHWQISYDELESELFSNNVISLPSITNVISIETHSNLVELELACSVFQRKIMESIDFWISYSLIPIKLPELGNFTIITSMYNDPPSESEMNANLPFNVTTAYNCRRNVYLVGPNPTGIWEDRGFEKKLVEYNPDTEDWTLLYLGDSTVKWSVYLRDDSVLYKNSILTRTRTTGDWKVYSLFKRDATFRGRTHRFSEDVYTTMVYNGKEWCNLKGEIPSKKILNRDENLFRDIPLNNFTSLYSLLEIQLAFAYLNEGSYKRHNKKRHFNYNGIYAPLDPGYIKDWVKQPPVRNDIDTLFYSQTAYSPILTEYKNLVFDNDKINGIVKSLSFRHDTSITSPKQTQIRKQNLFYNSFTKLNEYGADMNLLPQINPGEYLKAINPDFFEEIQVSIEAEDKKVVLETMMVDFENYVINTMQLLTSPFAYIQNGGEFLNKKLIPVLNFFKPFRVKLLDFLTKFEIYNPLMDSQLIDVEIDNINIEETIVEKPFPRNLRTTNKFSYSPDSEIPVLDYILGHGLATEDYFAVNIDHTINEPTYSPLDKDQKFPSLDINMKDAVFIIVNEGGSPIYDYRSDDGIISYIDDDGYTEVEILDVEE